MIFSDIWWYCFGAKKYRYNISSRPTSSGAGLRSFITLWRVSVYTVVYGMCVSTGPKRSKYQNMQTKSNKTAITWRVLVSSVCLMPYNCHAIAARRQKKPPPSVVLEAVGSLPPAVDTAVRWMDQKCDAANFWICASRLRTCSKLTLQPSPFASWLRLVLMPRPAPQALQEMDGWCSADPNWWYAIYLHSQACPRSTCDLASLRQRKHNAIRPNSKLGCTEDSVWLKRASQKSSSVYCCGMIHGDNFTCPKWPCTQKGNAVSARFEVNTAQRGHKSWACRKVQNLSTFHD